MSDDYVLGYNIEVKHINICTIDPDSGYCMGCSRTQEEIDKWKSILIQLKNGKRII